MTLQNSIYCYLTAGHTKLHLGDERPPLGYLWGEGAQRRSAYENLSCHYIMTGAESEQPVGSRFTSGWAAETMQDLFAFLIRVL